mgnify:CR=1 FL=1
MVLLNKNVQTIFNEIKGIVEELNVAEDFCSVTLSVGNHNARKVNFVCKATLFNNIVHDKVHIGDKVSIRFYAHSRFKHDRWYTNCNILEIQKV